MIIIDPGHGGWDPGGGSNSHFKEKDLTLKISKYQNQRFKELGLPSILVRNNDETLNPNERINRIKNLNSKETDILISNHINNGGSSGGEIIYSVKSNGELAKIIGDALKNSGLKIRNVYQRTGKTGRDYYYILRDTNPKQSMIIEYGFADDINDTKKLLYEWPILAESVVYGITKYFQIPYTPPRYVIHIVKPNESLYSISQLYNIPISEIKRKNNLTSNTIYPKTEIII